MVGEGVDTKQPFQKAKEEKKNQMVQEKYLEDLC